MSAPRIDTFRRTMDAVVDRLAELWPDVEDIHDLAYNRHRAAGEAKVHGGSRDYALDTHGDMIARELYIDVAAQLVGLGRGLETATKALRRHLNADSGRVLHRDGTADVTAAEFAQARYARIKRLARGEHHPHVNVAQPGRKPHVDPTVELEHLRGAIRRIVTHLEREHTDCRHDSDERGLRKRKPRPVARETLTPAQRAALDRALSVPDQAQAS